METLVNGDSVAIHQDYTSMIEWINKTTALLIFFMSDFDKIYWNIYILFLIDDKSQCFKSGILPLKWQVTM